jgi:hypothetical protein
MSRPDSPYRMKLCVCGHVGVQHFSRPYDEAPKFCMAVSGIKGAYRRKCRCDKFVEVCEWERYDRSLNLRQKTPPKWHKCVQPAITNANGVPTCSSCFELLLGQTGCVRIPDDVPESVLR